MSKWKYIGPDIPVGTRLLSFGKEIVPTLWDDAECEKWFAIDPRYKTLFSETKKADTADTKETK
jgi:hypothetical protein